MAAKLCESYQVNGQTAWSLLKKTERFKVRIITSLNAGDIDAMLMKKASSINDALMQCASANKGYVLPLGAKNFINASLL
jgi:hypothetical protein